jgi:two-component system phosphate regulon sensor histidine kinase PhoR
MKINLNEDLIRQANEEVIQWNIKRKEELEQMKKLESYRKEFLGDVSHELKTPIFNIQGYILTLLDGADKNKEINREYLKKSAKNIERMINLVDDLEIISQLETGEIKPEFSRFDIIAVSREVYEMLEFTARKRKINLVFHENVKKDSQLQVWADKNRIKQVLTNLVDNSIKYGNENGRTKLSFYDMFENILVEVSDNGIGIETIHIPRLFDRFFRVDKSRSRSIGGSGLGLAIVKHILESHKQTINVRSTPGVGSTFSFTLNKTKPEIKSEIP